MKKSQYVLIINLYYPKLTNEFVLTLLSKKMKPCITLSTNDKVLSIVRICVLLLNSKIYKS